MKPSIKLFRIKEMLGLIFSNFFNLFLPLEIVADVFLVTVAAPGVAAALAIFVIRKQEKKDTDVVKDRGHYRLLQFLTEPKKIKEIKKRNDKIRNGI